MESPDPTDFMSIDPPGQQPLILAADLVIEARTLRAALPEVLARVHQEHLALDIVDIAEPEHREIAAGEIALLACPANAAHGDARSQKLRRPRYGLWRAGCGAAHAERHRAHQRLGPVRIPARHRGNPQGDTV